MTFDAIIEIPKGSRNKYEYDKETGKIRLDRVLFSPMHYPADYGFVPDTLALDGDPLDVLVFLTEPTIPGCVIEVKPIGVFLMEDDKGPDEKLFCVPVADPIWSQLNELEDLNSHILLEVEHFFKVYKDLEKKKVISKGFAGRDVAEQLLAESIERYKALV